MNSLLVLHTRKLILLAGLAVVILICSSLLGERKAGSEIDWIDVFGEGSSAVATLIWLVMILRSRPAGRVTNLLTLGLGFMFLAMWQDTLDEFFRLSGSQSWEGVVESTLLPVGLVLLTYGLWHWHKEQLSIRGQLLKREQVFRDHLWLDGLSQIARLEQVTKTLNAHWNDPNEHQVLLMIELHDFDIFERRYGYREAERLLRETGEYLILNLRHRDLLCRFARDRLVLLLPHTRISDARLIAEKLRAAVQHFSYYLTDSDEAVEQSLDIGIGVRQREDLPEDLLKRSQGALKHAIESNGLSLVS